MPITCSWEVEEAAYKHRGWLDYKSFLPHLVKESWPHHVVPGTGRQEPRRLASISQDQIWWLLAMFFLSGQKESSKLKTGVASLKKQNTFFPLSPTVKLRFAASGLRQIVSYRHPCDCFLVAFMITRIELQILHYYFQSSARCEPAKLNKDLNLRFLSHYLFFPDWYIKDKK